MHVYLGAKFQVSKVTLKSFKKWGNFTPPTSKQAPKKPTHIRIKSFGN